MTTDADAFRAHPNALGFCSCRVLSALAARRLARYLILYFSLSIGSNSLDRVPVLHRTKNMLLWLLLPALLLSPGVPGGEAARILVLAPMPARSHMNVVTAVTKALAARGHDVTFFSGEPLGKDLPPNHRVISIGNPLKDDKVERLSMFFRTRMNPWIGLIFMKMFGSTLVNATLAHPAFQAEINKPGAKFDLVIAETFFFMEAFLAVAHRLDAQVVSINPFGTTFVLSQAVGNAVNPSWVPEPVIGFTDRMGLYQRTVSTLFIMYQYVLYNVLFLPSQQALATQYFPDAPPLTELLRTRNALTLLNNHYSLFYPIPMAPNCVEVGGMHIQDPKPLPKDLKEFMDGAQNGVVFFSMGSNLKVEFMPKFQADAILGALGSLKQPVLLKWDGPSPKVASNIRVVDWVPQSDLLAHPNLRVFVTHGGLLSTQEAVYHGVPVVGIPVFGDQHFNMDLAVNKGFGVQVDLFTITKESLADALREVIENPKYTKAAKHLSVLFRAKPQKPLDTAVFWVEHVLAHGGDHMRPSSLDLDLYQVLLLDVLLVLLTPVLLLGWCCWAVCCGRRKAAHTTSKKKTN